MRSLTLFLLSLVFTISSCVSTQQTQQKSQQEKDTATESKWAPAEGPLKTRWTKDVDPQNPLPEYPRPQMKRSDWKNLNGLWQYAMGAESKEPPFNTELGQQILVPFAIESSLSGVQKRTDSLYYRHTFEIPGNWEGQRVLLHFGAVDWKSTVYVNGTEVGIHKGGYDAFSFDITDELKEGNNELIVEVYDPSDDGNQPRGKQVKNPRGIWYTPVTGIWQTVWLEPVPDRYISDLRLTPDVDNEELDIRVDGEGSAAGTVRAIGYAGDKEIGRSRGKIGEAFSLPVPDPKLWNTENPYLYDLKVQLLSNGRVVDEVDSYFGMRKIEIKKDEEGQAKIFLNDKFVYQLGPLDQGYWPDGLYTAPTDEALRYDLEMTKKLGFNMNRKHVKVEPARWYYWADKLGVLVWQDMVTGSNATPESKKQFQHELEEMVTQFHNHPSIVNWVIFNEGWGQFDTERITKAIEELDKSRIITDASGWQHSGEGDIIDIHRYPGPAAIKPTSDRAAVVGEFGGIGYLINGHIWGGGGWGYQGIIRRPETYIDRYEESINRLRWMSEKYGMSGGVYTQLTDLETELNGILTYDRHFAKAAVLQFASVNKGITPYIHPTDGNFMENIEVEIMNWADNTKIRYTLDGSEPDNKSRLYDGPIILSESDTIRARSFRNGKPIGYANSRSFTKVEGKEPAQQSVDKLTQGLSYKYYESPAEDAPTYRKHWPLRGQLRGSKQVLEPTEEGAVENFVLSPKQQDKLFAFEYAGYIDIPEDGVYTFHIAADDDAKMYIGDKQIFDRLGQSPTTAYDRERIALKKGLHKIELRYFQGYGPFELNVTFEGPGIEKQQIPDKFLYRSN